MRFKYKCREKKKLLSVCYCTDSGGSATPWAPVCSCSTFLCWHHWFDCAVPISWRQGSWVLSWDQLRDHSRSKQETNTLLVVGLIRRVIVFNSYCHVNPMALLTFSPTIGITPQKECVSDAHCVVDIQIKLQITKEGRSNKEVIINTSFWVRWCCKHKL